MPMTILVCISFKKARDGSSIAWGTAAIYRESREKSTVKELWDLWKGRNIALFIFIFKSDSFSSVVSIFSLSVIFYYSQILS
jgi:hypothetical protein